MRKKEVTEKPSYLKLLPIGLILAIVPIIVYLKEIKLDEAFAKLWRGATEELDFFSYYKMVWFLALSFLSVIVFFIYVYVKKIKLTIPKLFIPLGIYAVFAFLSSSFSEYHAQAFFGFPERYEGFFTILCYLVVCFICSMLVSSEFDIKYLTLFLAFSVLILSILGLTQFFGYDIIQSHFGRKLILPKDLEYLAHSLNFKFPEQYIYSTLYNPNYVGGFFAIILSVCIVVFLASSKPAIKIISGLFCLLTFMNLIGSLSETGMISMIASGIVILMFMRKKLVKNILPILALLICFIGATLFMNHSSDGKIFKEFNISGSFTDIKHRLNALITPDPDSSNKASSTSTLMLMRVEQESDIIAAENVGINSNSLLAVNNTSASMTTSREIYDLSIDNHNLYIYTSDKDALVINYDPATSEITFADSNKNPLKTVVTSTENKAVVNFSDEKFSFIKISIEKNVVFVEAPNTTFSFTNTNEGFKIVTPAGNLTDIIKAESFGFQGKEKWGSNRGYIWSRSIPMIKDTLLLGHGPDTYALYFPNNDYVAKMKFLEGMYTMVDKPHNLYLQIAINTGCISLLAFLVFIGWYLLQSIRLYLKGTFNVYFATGVACLAAVTSYLVSSLANDSTISVSLTFWIILGVGIACNRLYARTIA